MKASEHLDIRRVQDYAVSRPTSHRRFICDADQSIDINIERNIDGDKSIIVKTDVWCHYPKVTQVYERNAIDLNR